MSKDSFQPPYLYFPPLPTFPNFKIIQLWLYYLEVYTSYMYIEYTYITHSIYPKLFRKYLVCHRVKEMRDTTVHGGMV